MIGVSGRFIKFQFKIVLLYKGFLWYKGYSICLGLRSFLWEQVAWALAMIVLVMGLTAYILYKSFQHRITTGYLLLPYFLWLGFAEYLTGTILWLNG